MSAFIDKPTIDAIDTLAVGTQRRVRVRLGGAK